MRLADLIAAYGPRTQRLVQKRPRLTTGATQALTRAMSGWTFVDDADDPALVEAHALLDVVGTWKSGSDRLTLGWDPDDPDAPWVFRQTRWARVPPKPVTKGQKPEPKPTTTHEVRAGRIEDAIALLHTRARDPMAAPVSDGGVRRRARLRVPTTTHINLADASLVPEVLKMRAAEGSTLIVRVLDGGERVYRRTGGAWTERRTSARRAG